MKITFKFPDSVPRDQINEQFIQGMLDRMAVGYHNYGHMRRKYNRPDNGKNIRIRWKEYMRTGNTEFLMDLSNFSMMEFTVPAHHKAHFKSTKAEDSPGSVVDGRLVKNKKDFKKVTGFHAPRIQREGD
jgi:hypothetical protein